MSAALSEIKSSPPRIVQFKTPALLTYSLASFMFLLLANRRALLSASHKTPAQSPSGKFNP